MKLEETYLFSSLNMGSDEKPTATTSISSFKNCFYVCETWEPFAHFPSLRERTQTKSVWGQVAGEDIWK
jgi:hypothetical protein